MFNNIRTKLLRFRDLSWKDLTNLYAWPKRLASFNPFTAENFSSSTLRVATVADEQGTVCFCPVEQVFIVSSNVMRPGTSLEDEQLAADLINETIENEAQRRGIAKMLIVLPVNHPATFEGEWRTVKICEQAIPQAAARGGVDSLEPISAAKYVN